MFLKDEILFELIHFFLNFILSPMIHNSVHLIHSSRSEKNINRKEIPINWSNLSAPSTPNSTSRTQSYNKTKPNQKIAILTISRPVDSSQTVQQWPEPICTLEPRSGLSLVLLDGWGICGIGSWVCLGQGLDWKYTLSWNQSVNCFLVWLFSFLDSLVPLPDSVPNTCINEFDLGFPGTLPKLNNECLRLALTAALSLNCQISDTLTFDRKHYFYPDLTLGYHSEAQ